MDIQASSSLLPPWQQALTQMEAAQAAPRLWAGDAGLWSADAAVAATIRNRLGWLRVAAAMQAQGEDLLAFAQQIRQAGFTAAVLLGMGGSSLAPEVLSQVFGHAEGIPVHVLDTTDPVTIAHVEARLELKRTLFIVSSKSGGTIEPNSLMAYFWERAGTARGGDPAPAFIAITDPETSLQKLAAERGFRRIFVNPADIGGRYSALSYFGLVPAALLGIDVRALLARAVAMMKACGPEVPALHHPGLRLGTALGAWARLGRDKLTLLSGEGLGSFGMWLEQLIAESTGKQGHGIVPIAGEPVGAPESYGADRVFVALNWADGGDLVPAALAEEAPVIRIGLEDRYDLAQQFFLWEFATAIAGAVLGINPFDEPNVKESKDNTSRVIEQYRQGGAAAAGLEAPAIAAEGALRLYAPQATPSASALASLRDFLLAARPGDYLALMGYFEATAAVERGLEAMRVYLRDALHLATTLGYGPRFLHSTGQLHKGGANTGLFLQLTAAPAADLPIPGQTYSFGTLMAAQALGDYQSLASHQRRLLRIDLGKDVPGGLRQLQALLETAVAGKAGGAKG